MWGQLVLLAKWKGHLEGGGLLECLPLPLRGKCQTTLPRKLGDFWSPSTSVGGSESGYNFWIHEWVGMVGGWLPPPAGRSEIGFVWGNSPSAGPAVRPTERVEGKGERMWSKVANLEELMGVNVELVGVNVDLMDVNVHFGARLTPHDSTFRSRCSTVPSPSPLKLYAGSANARREVWFTLPLHLGVGMGSFLRSRGGQLGSQLRQLSTSPKTLGKLMVF